MNTTPKRWIGILAAMTLSQSTLALRGAGTEDSNTVAKSAETESQSANSSQKELESAKALSDTKSAEAAKAAEVAKTAEDTRVSEGAKAADASKTAESAKALATAKAEEAKQASDAYKAAESTRSSEASKLNDLAKLAESTKATAASKAADAAKSNDSREADEASKAAATAKAAEEAWKAELPKADEATKAATVAKELATIKASEASKASDSAKAAEAISAVRNQRASEATRVAEAAQSVLATKTTEATSAAEKLQTLETTIAKIAEANGGLQSPVQSSARPLGLNVVGPVMAAGSDPSAAAFQSDALTAVTDMLNSKLSETKKVDDSAMLLDPSKLTLQTDADVRVYFVGEGAGYKNTLGFNTTGTGVTSGDPLLIFPDASSSVSTYDPASKAVRSTSAPLLPGDFVNLGLVESGTLLNFFLIANGANGGKTVFSTDQSANPDGINHVVAFAYAVPGSSFLVLGFEDLLGGGDRDFNDLLFAVDIGAQNIAALTGTPEPALCLTLGSFVVGALWLKRRRDSSAGNTSFILA